MGKRPYNEARRRANDKYNARAYVRVTVNLRVDEDEELIKDIELAQQKGKSYREWLRDLYYR